MIRVTIVDDHELFTEGLAMALNAVPDIEVTATYPDGDAFIHRRPTVAMDVLILDLDMPAISGLEILDLVDDGVKAIVVSMHAGETERLAAFDRGARAFLSKSTPLSDVAAAIRAVNDGRLLKEPDTTIREILGTYQQPRLDPGAASLTQRERELLTLISRGVSSTDDLAENLFISQKTVKNHLASIYDKLAISDRAQAAVEAIRLGLDRE